MSDFVNGWGTIAVVSVASVYTQGTDGDMDSSSSSSSSAREELRVYYLFFYQTGPAVV